MCLTYAEGNPCQRLNTWTLKCRGYDERFQMETWKVALKQVEEGREEEEESDDDDDEEEEEEE